MPIKIFLLIFIFGTTSLLPQNELNAVRSLKVDSLTSELTVYYTPGYKQRAEYLADFLIEAKYFFKDSLVVEYDYSLAVLDETQWNELNSPYPYGLPWNNAFRPYVIFMPADTSHGAVVDDLSNFLKREDANKYVDNIGFHEAGHTYVCEYIYGGRFTDPEIPFRWFDELMANYFCYALLRSVHPDMADLLYDVAFRDYNTDELTYTTLQHFEDHYFEIPPPNYHWYQITFIKRVIDVYNKSGLNFIREVKEKISWDMWRTTEELLLELEEITPGFIKWAAQLRK
ncbi:MAG TPA: hypothetical protein VIZ21_02840 [Ignavibacteriaceae bacterium]